jgi:hypothetical protein
MNFVFERSIMRSLLAAAVVVAFTLLCVGKAAVAAQTAAPANTSPPTISGTAEAGRSLTASTGSWTGTTPIHFDFQWQRCDSAGANCSLIPGATSQTYTLVGADVGKRIRVVVTARNVDGSRQASSAPTAVVKAAPSGAPKNTSRPGISGKEEEGSALTVSNGGWSGTQPITFSYLWLRCDSSGGACTTIVGATSKSYTLAAADVSKRLRATVTATNSAGAASETSNPTGTSRAAPASAPRNTAVPAISGTATVGQTLTASNGTWTGTEPIRYTYSWQRCDSAGSSCAAISGATGQTYPVTSADQGNRLRVVVTASNTAGSSNATSATTAGVGSGAPSGTIQLPSGKKSVPASSVSLPAQFIIDNVKFSPSVLTSRARTVTARIHVSDSRGNVVRDARVLLTGVPFGWITSTPEVATATDGWATLTFRATAKLPSRGSIVMFLRARKLGDNLLAGVSARRLVQLRVAIG